MAIISKDSAKTKISHLEKVMFKFCFRNPFTPELTFSIPPVYVILRKFLEIVFEQHLVSWHSLNRLQHVMLQRQTSTNFLPLNTQTQTREFTSIKEGENKQIYPEKIGLDD